MKKLDQELFVCLDCETTGLDPKQDQIIEVAAATFMNGTIVEEFQTLINPGCPIPPSSIAFHNITDQMVVNKPTISEVLPRLLKLVDKHRIIGHSVGFDIEIVANSAEKMSLPCTIRENGYIDTLRMARLYGESPTNSLETLRRHFNIEPEGAHRAMSDVIVNIEVFKFLSKQYRNMEHLLETLKRPILMKVMPLGKHKGRPLNEIPLDYLLWASRKDFDEDLLFSLKTEIKRRKQSRQFSQASNPFSIL